MGKELVKFHVNVRSSGLGLSKLSRVRSKFENIELQTRNIQIELLQLRDLFTPPSASEPTLLVEIDGIIR